MIAINGSTGESSSNPFEQSAATVNGMPAAGSKSPRVATGVPRVRPQSLASQLPPERLRLRLDAVPHICARWSRSQRSRRLRVDPEHLLWVPYSAAYDADASSDSSDDEDDDDDIEEPAETHDAAEKPTGSINGSSLPESSSMLKIGVALHRYDVHIGVVRRCLTFYLLAPNL